MAEQASVNIPKDLLEPIIRQHIHAGIIAAIGDPEKLIAGVVDRAMREKVDSSGRIDRNSSYRNSHDLIEVVSKDAIIAASKDAIEAYVDEQRPAIEKAVRAQLQRKTTALAKALVDGFVDCAKQDWRLGVTFTLKDN